MLIWYLQQQDKEYSVLIKERGYRNIKKTLKNKKWQKAEDMNLFFIHKLQVFILL